MEDAGAPIEVPRIAFPNAPNALRPHRSVVVSVAWSGSAMVAAAGVTASASVAALGKHEGLAEKCEQLVRRSEPSLAPCIHIFNATDKQPLRWSSLRPQLEDKRPSHHYFSLRRPTAAPRESLVELAVKFLLEPSKRRVCRRSDCMDGLRRSEWGVTVGGRAPN
jgi:hypothetical protein